VLIVVAVLLVLAAAGWLAVRSPWATVQRIRVSGTDRIPVTDVRAEAETEIGHPMLLARTGDIRGRIAKQHLVQSVSVRRHWPSELRIQVVERRPVAALPSGSQLALVDPDGVVIDRVATAPAGMPRLKVSLGTDVSALRGCLAVLHDLPPGVKGRLAAIGADSPDGIWLELKDGARVEWGSSADTPRKGRVLLALLKQKARFYDVQAPDAPAIRTT
jgi:cell division protein FtsQ